MGRMRDQREMSDEQIRRFFQDYWQAGEIHEIVRKNPETSTFSTGFTGQSNEWYEQCIELASKSSCCLCGKHPSGDDTTVALVAHKPSGTFFMGVCSKCASSTIGQSSIRIFYRAWVGLIDQGVRNKYLGVMNGQLYNFDEGNTVP